MTTPLVRAIALAFVCGCMSASIDATQDVATAPVKLTDVKPQYTPEAMRAKIQGEVVVVFEIRADGTVGKAEIERSLDRQFGLDEKALEAVRQWKFRPATRNGVAFATMAHATLAFVLRNGPAGPPPPSLPALPTPNEWPELVIDAGTTADAALHWTPGSVAIGNLKLDFATPTGWESHAGEPGPLLLRLGSPNLRRLMMVGPPRPLPSAELRLPLSADGLRHFAESMSTAAKDKVDRKFGQVQAGSRWWLWIELPPGAGLPETMPPMARDAFTASGITELAGWAFVTFEDGQMIQVLCMNGIPSGPEHDGERLSAASMFRAAIQHMRFSR